MNKLNVIITSPSLDTAKNIGGISTVTDFLINSNKDVEYKHFTLGKLDKEKRDILWMLRILKTWILWGFLMIFNRNILVHFNFALDLRSIIRDTPLILFSMLLRKKIIIHLHGGEYLNKDKTPKLIQGLLRILFSGKNPKIVLSPIEESIIREKYKADNIFVLPNSVNLYEAAKFTRSFPFPKPLKLLFIGRIVKRKGIYTILEALKLLIDKGYDFKYFVAGNGPDKNEYLENCSAVLGSAFEFKGVVSGTLKTDLYKESNIFLLPSLYGEGLPISLLECMSFQVVPVVTDDGSMTYIIQDGINGILVDKGSPDQISDAIENLFEHEDLIVNLAQNARNYIFDNHNPGNYIIKLNNIYENALN